MRYKSINADLFLFVFFMTAGFISSFYLCYINDDFGFIFLYILFFFLLAIINFYHGNAIYPLIAFCLYVSVIPLYQASFFINNGTVFTPGGDAEKYYNFAIDYGLYDEDLIEYRYWFFILLFGKYYSIIDYFHGGRSPAYFSMLSSFFSALTVPFYYSAIKNMADEKYARIVSYLWIFTPLFIFLAVGQLRDIYAYIAPAYIFYYFSVKSKGLDKTRHLITLFFILFYSALIRVDVFIYCCVFIAAFYLLDESRFTRKIFSSLFVLVVVAMIAVNSSTIMDQVSINNFSTQVDVYQQQCDIGCDNNSTIRALQGSWYGILILALLSYYTPFPTFILDGKYTFYYFLEMLFVFIWAFFSVFFIRSVFFKMDDVYKKAFLISLIALLITLGMTTVGFYRQKIYVYPIIYYYIIHYIVNHLENKGLIRYLAVISSFISFAFVFFIFRHRII